MINSKRYLITECELLKSGYLVKSPPLKTKRGLAKFLKARWRRRFFYLYTQPNSQRTEYVLDYFIDEKAGRQKGSVDLANCQHIVSNAEVGSRQNVFSLKTLHKGQERVYYLSADSVQDMNSWVQMLCRVCGCTTEDLRVFPDDMMPATPVGTWPRPSFNSSSASPMAKNAFFPSYSTPVPAAPSSGYYSRQYGNSLGPGNNPTSSSSLQRSSPRPILAPPSAPGSAQATSSGSNYYNLMATEPSSQRSSRTNQSDRQTPSPLVTTRHPGIHNDHDDAYRLPSEVSSSYDARHSYVNMSIDQTPLPPIITSEEDYLHPPSISPSELQYINPVDDNIHHNQTHSTGAVVIDGNEYILASEIESSPRPHQEINPFSRTSPKKQSPNPDSDYQLPSEQKPFPPNSSATTSEYYNVWDLQDLGRESDVPDVPPPVMPRASQRTSTGARQASPSPLSVFAPPVAACGDVVDSSRVIDQRSKANHPFELSNAKIYRQVQHPPINEDCALTKVSKWCTPMNGEEAPTLELPRRTNPSTTSSSSSGCTSSDELSDIDELPPPIPPPPASKIRRAAASSKPSIIAEAPPLPPARSPRPTVGSMGPPSKSPTELNYIDAERLDLGPTTKAVGFPLSSSTTGHKRGTSPPVGVVNNNVPKARVVSVTEYKDIDLVSTNVLAQVTKQYLKGQES